MSRNKRLIALALTLFVALVLSGSSLISEDKLSGQSIVNYKTTEIVRGDFVKTGQGTGALYYVNTQNVKFSDAAARLNELYIRKEQPVSKGETLLLLDIEGSRASLTELELATRRMIDERRQTELADERALELAQKAVLEATDPYERELARLDLELKKLDMERQTHTYEYNLRNNQESIAQIEADFAKGAIASPIDGFVKTFTLKNAGDTITGYDSLVTVYSKDRIVLKVEDTTKMIRYNMAVRIETGGRNNPQTYTGRVIAADNVLPEELRTGFAFVELDDESVDLEEQKFIKIYFDSVRVNDVLLAPKKALTMERGFQYAKALTDDVLQKRYVSTALNNTEYFWILQGLTEGQTVVLN